MMSMLIRLDRAACAVVLSLTAVVAVSAQQLLPSVNIRTVPTMGQDQWPADFSGDGITDLVGSRQGSGALQVVLGNGDVTFRAPIVSAVTGTALGVGDLNRDRAIDVVAQVGNQVAVLPGNRTGALGSPRTVLAAHAEFVGGADMYGDGIRDVVIGEQDESLHVVAGNGDRRTLSGRRQLLLVDAHRLIPVAMPADIYVGLPVTNHDNTTLATAVFDDVSLSP